MMASCIHRLTPSLAPVPPAQEKEHFNWAGRIFDVGCSWYGFSALMYTASLFTAEQKQVMTIFAHCAKGLSGAAFLKSAWDARKVDKLGARDFALCSVALVVGIVVVESILGSLTTSDDPVRKYGLAAMGICLNIAILGIACTIAYKKQSISDYERIE